MSVVIQNPESFREKLREKLKPYFEVPGLQDEEVV